VSRTAALSKVREFSPELPPACNVELARALRRDRSLWHTVDPTRFETFVAAVFRANHRQAEVRHVGRSGDGGVDVVYIDDNERQSLIQVKRRARATAVERVGTIRNLPGAMLLKKSKYGIVVSTADHFAYQSHRAVAEALGLGYTVNLLDRGLLDRMLQPLVLRRKPWRQIITHHTGTSTYVRSLRPSTADLPWFLWRHFLRAWKMSKLALARACWGRMKRLVRGAGMPSPTRSFTCSRSELAA